MKELVFYYASFNLDALLRLAESLRHIPCTCERKKMPYSGSMNWAIELRFEDSVQWIFRSPRRASITKLPEALVGRLIASEAATMKYISTHTTIPVPEVFHYSASSDNDVGVPYILMSKASGQNLSTYHWPTFSLRRTKSPPPLRTEDKEKVMHQLGAIAAQLSQVRFDKIGSLFEDEDGYIIKECLSPGHIFYGRDSLSIDRGPFSKEIHYYESLVSGYRAHTTELSIDSHVFFAPLPVPDEYSTWDDYQSATMRWNDFVTVKDKANSFKNRLDYYVASQLVADMLPRLLSQAYPTGFPLRHFDLNTGNIFVDKNMNITCIIDWALSSSAPFVELLAAPGMPHPTYLPDPSLTASYRAGFEQRFGAKQGWDDTERVWHFQRLLYLDSSQDRSHLQQLYTLLTKKEERQDILSVFPRAREEASREFAGLFKKYTSHSDEKIYFSKKTKTDREAVARKLTVMMELNEMFVADRRLWHWIRGALREPDLNIGTEH